MDISTCYDKLFKAHIQHIFLCCKDYISQMKGTDDYIMLQHSIAKTPLMSSIWQTEV